MTAKEEEHMTPHEIELRSDLIIIVGQGTQWSYYDTDMLVNLIMRREAALSQQHEREIAVLHGDIAYAIGYCSGIGHPCAYLERHYPDLAQQQSNGGKHE